LIHFAARNSEDNLNSQVSSNRTATPTWKEQHNGGKKMEEQGLFLPIQTGLGNQDG
jgi:hypothetical protein